jgi:uncharacterized protein YbjT (DUF2867 family)
MVEVPSLETPLIPIGPEEDLFCYDLPSSPRPSIGTVLVTGASGYIGGRLVPELLARGYHVRVMVRTASPAYEERWPRAEIVVADALNIDALKTALEGVHTAYYLIHSLLRGPKGFALVDRQTAENFRKTAEAKEVKRIIYLGGLGDIRSHLSDHLRARMEVGEELKRGKVPVTILRAAIIMGSGSASYEIIEHLVKRLPFILIPHWAENKCQPIGIRDVIKYLVGVLEEPETSGKSFDIGGKDILTYAQMMKIMAEVLGKRVFFIHFPYANLKFYAYIGSFLTPVPTAVTRALIEGLRNEVICQDETIKRYVSFAPISYKEAIIRAMSREKQDKVSTRWSDAYPPSHAVAISFAELKESPRYNARYTLTSEKTASALFNSVCKIGGKEGWFHYNWMWRLRGALDSLLLGVGHSRGRRSSSSLRINDVIDFWRVEDLQFNKRLLLRSEMKLPGRAWLEFKIEEETNKRIMSVIVYYDTRSFFGKAYWYLFLPFHNLIFKDLLEQIEVRG